MYKGYINAGYEIRCFHEIDNNGVAIGMRSGIKDDPAPFAVWHYTMSNGVPSFYWGTYLDDKCKAVTTFVEKVRGLVGNLDWSAWCSLRTQKESE